MTDQNETERLLHYMPIVVRGSTVTDWERKFCASIIAQSRKGLRPSEKQIGVMRRIVDDFQSATMRLTDDEGADARE